MLIGHGSDLRQVRDADDLFGRRELTELLPHTLCGHAGDAGIHLVKDHGGHVVALGKDVFERQHDARQLTAGCDLTDAAERLAGVRRDQETHIVRPCGLKAGVAAERCDLHVETHRRHGQLAQFALDLPLQCRCSGLACLRQFCCLGARLLGLLLDQ